MSQLHVVHFTVVGKGYFPADMLRYDACYPEGQRDVDPIFLTERPEVRQQRTVHLSTRVHGSKREVQKAIDEKRLPTVARWHSFMWAVKDVKIWSSS